MYVNNLIYIYIVSGEFYLFRFQKSCWEMNKQYVNLQLEFVWIQNRYRKQTTSIFQYWIFDTKHYEFHHHHHHHDSSRASQLFFAPNSPSLSTRIIINKQKHPRNQLGVSLLAQNKQNGFLAKNPSRKMWAALSFLLEIHLSSFNQHGPEPRGPYGSGCRLLEI